MKTPGPESSRASHVYDSRHVCGFSNDGVDYVIRKFVENSSAYFRPLSSTLQNLETIWALRYRLECRFEIVEESAPKIGIDCVVLGHDLVQLAVDRRIDPYPYHASLAVPILEASAEVFPRRTCLAQDGAFDARLDLAHQHFVVSFGGRAQRVEKFHRDLRACLLGEREQLSA